MIEVHKINESFSYLTGTKEELEKVFKSLRIYDPSMKFNRLVKMGLKSPYKEFASFQNGVLLVYNGHLPLILKQNEIKYSDEFSKEIDEFVKGLDLPFTPYDYQINAVKEAIFRKKALLKSCTSCLDPNTEIDVDIPGYTEKEIRTILQNTNYF